MRKSKQQLLLQKFSYLPKFSEITKIHLNLNDFDNRMDTYAMSQTVNMNVASNSRTVVASANHTNI